MRDHPYRKEGVRIDVPGLVIAVLEFDPQHIGRGVVDIGHPQIFDGRALGGGVDQRRLEVGFFRQALGVVRRDIFRILSALEGLDLPTCRSVVGFDNCQPLQRRIDANRSGPIDRLVIFQLHIEAAGAHRTGHLHCPDRLDRRQSASRCRVSPHDRLGG